jgi:hypothetical protein
MLSSMSGLGAYGITSIIIIILSFFLFARFVKKIICNIILGGLLFYLLNLLNITHMSLTVSHGIVISLLGIPGTIILAIMDLL